MIIISSEKLNLRHIVHICKTGNNLYKSHLKISRKTVVNFTWYKGMGVGYTTYTFTIPVPPFNHIAETFVKFLYHIDTRTHCLTQHLYMCMHDCTHTHTHTYTHTHYKQTNNKKTLTFLLLKVTISQTLLSTTEKSGRCVHWEKLNASEVRQCSIKLVKRAVYAASSFHTHTHRGSRHRDDRGRTICDDERNVT